MGHTVLNRDVRNKRLRKNTEASEQEDLGANSFSRWQEIRSE